VKGRWSCDVSQVEFKVVISIKFQKSTANVNGLNCAPSMRASARVFFSCVSDIVRRRARQCFRPFSRRDRISYANKCRRRSGITASVEQKRAILVTCCLLRSASKRASVTKGYIAYVPYLRAESTFKFLALRFESVTIGAIVAVLRATWFAFASCFSGVLFVYSKCNANYELFALLLEQIQENSIIITTNFSSPLNNWL